MWRALFLVMAGCAIPIPTEVAVWGGEEVPITQAMWQDMDAARQCAGVRRAVPKNLRLWIVPDSSVLVVGGYDVAGFSRGPHIVLKADYVRARYLRHEGLHAAIGGDAYHQHSGWGKGSMCGFPQE